MSWWMAIPAVLQAGAAIAGASGASKQNESQLAINRYNAGMQYQTDINNANSVMAIGGMNAAMAMAAGRVNASAIMQAAQLQSSVGKQVAQYNAEMTRVAAGYNDSLFAEELTNLWEAAELDMALLENQRAVEAGAITADQAASGTVLGEGSNADVLIDQETQAQLDAFIVRHNANTQANSIKNARAKGMWEANMQIQKIMWEGELNSYATLTNARIQSGAALAQAGLQAAGTLATAAISSNAERRTAVNRYNAGMYGASQQYSSNRTAISTNLITGLFNAGATGVSTYFGAKQVPSPPRNTVSAPISTATRSASQLARSGNPAWERVLQGQISQPGGTLL